MHERVLPPAETPIVAAADPPRDGTGLDDPRALQILTTEHWSLLSARSLAYNEAFTRAAMLVTAVTGTLVALGFVSQATGFGAAFGWIAILLLSLDLVLAIATLIRMHETDEHDLRCVQGMNRLRHAYFSIAPAVREYFITSGYDDMRGVAISYGTVPVTDTPRANLIHGLGTLSTVVGVILALLLGAVAGLLAAQLGVDPGLATGVGIAGFLATMVLEGVISARQIERLVERLDARYPSPPAS